MNQTLKVHGIPPSQNELKRMHYMKIHNEKMKWEHVVKVLVMEQKIKPVDKVIVTYEFWFKTNQRRDADNYAACAKMLQDGLVKAKILTDDNFNIVKELRIKHGGVSDKPYVLIHLEDAA